ncbi:outer membrane beta-barrel family protein [Pollutibacter soli]|uniref:outer membrane beta-barrel family protein n=1 Tax=Pollutibacter soli TaxID=3034157 RepID=UPI0030135E73
MRIVFTLFMSVLGLAASAQFPAGGGGRPGGGQNMNMGRFYGRILDSKTNKGVDAASVQLIQNKFDSVSKQRKDVVIAGQLTRANGDFSLEGLPIMGQFKLRVSGIGYQLYEKPVKFEIGGPRNGDMSQMLNKIDVDLGDIKLELDAKVMDEIKITGAKPFMQMGVDRRIFNVEKSLISTGQTATELMKNIPGIDVDIDGNVSLRNSPPTIFVDGRPTTLTLDQIPSDAIQSVEIITNPSAKFDASGGTAGILNIVLKKNRKAGYNGNLRAGVDSRLRFNGGGDINIKQEKVNLFASAMFNQRKSISEGTSVRQDFYTTPNITFNQKYNSENKGLFMFTRLGADFFLNNRNTLTVSGNYVQGGFDNVDDIAFKTDSIINSIVKSEYGNRTSTGDFKFQNVGGAIGYKKLFKKPGMEFTSDLNYTYNSNRRDFIYNTQYLDYNSNPKGIPIEQKQSGSGKNSFYTIQADFVNPINDKSKFELGVRAAVRDVQSENLNYIYDPVSGDYIPVVVINANYKYIDRVLAAYGTYSNMIGKKFTYQLGLRLESSRYKGTLLTDGSEFTNSYPFSAFPSAFLTYKLSESQDLQLSYSRRINRPNFFQLMPFVDYSDSLNISRGNPALVPEFTNSLEVSYQKTFKKNHSLLFSTYFKYTNDLITRYQVKEQSQINGRDIIVNTWVNANNSMSYGFEVTSKNPLAKWLEVTTNLNLYNSSINGENLSQDLANSMWSFFGKMNAAFKLPQNYSIQLSGDYRSRSVLPQGGSGGRGGGFGGGGGGPFGGAQTTAQGYIADNYGVDIAIRKDFLKDKAASITLSVNDIFRTRVYATHSFSEYFVQDVSRRRDWQVFRLNFNWRFGKLDASLFKRKNTRSGMDGIQEGNNMQQ